MKPIFIVTYPISVSDFEFDDTQDKLQEALNHEYLLIGVRSQKSEYEFHCFNHNLEEKQFEELKELVKSKL